MGKNGYNNTMGPRDFVRAGKCDMCYKYCSGVQMHSSGKRTVFICKICDGELYETVAEREKEEWVKFGRIRNQRNRRRNNRRNE